VLAGLSGLAGVIWGVVNAVSPPDDADPPTVTIEPRSRPAASTSDTSVAFAWRTSGKVTTTSCSFDGGPLEACSSPVERSGLHPGHHSFEVLVRGPGGNDADRYAWTVTPPPPPPPGAAKKGLSELNDAGDVEFSVDASFDAVNINGESYNDSVSGDVYPDDSGFGKLTVHTKRRFSAVDFTVGISADTDCPKARAKVSLTDEGGRVLWGPQVVTIDSSQTESVQIPKPVQLNLVQRSTATDDNSCTNATVAWGGVTFTSAPGG
jgi:hypothetical protein